MSTLLIREELTEEERSLLERELKNTGTKILSSITEEEWDQVEAIYGHQLSIDELDLALRLRWMHLPSPFFEQICMKELAARRNLMMTYSMTMSPLHVVEYVLAGALLHSKHFSRFACEIDELANQQRMEEAKKSVETLADRIFLQVGLDAVGTAIVSHLTPFRMKIWGISRHPSFHPNCRRVYGFDQLHALLPAADIVCFNPTLFDQNPLQVGMRELELMKKDAILIALNASNWIDEEALAERCKQRLLRGALIDKKEGEAVTVKSPLSLIPNVIVTPNISPLPKPKENRGFHDFRKNLRLFLQGNYQEMHQRVRVLP